MTIIKNIYHSIYSRFYIDKIKQDKVFYLKNLIYKELRYCVDYFKTANSQVINFIYHQNPYFFIAIQGEEKYEFIIKDLDYYMSWREFSQYEPNYKLKPFEFKIFEKIKYNSNNTNVRENCIMDIFEQHSLFSDKKHTKIFKTHYSVVNEKSIYKHSIVKNKELDSLVAILEQFYITLKDVSTYINNLSSLENNYLSSLSFNNIDIIEQYCLLIDSPLAESIFLKYMENIYTHSQNDRCQCYDKKIKHFLSLIEDMEKEQIYPYHADGFFKFAYKHGRSEWIKIAKKRLDSLSQLNSIYMNKKLSQYLDITLDKHYKRHINKI